MKKMLKKAAVLMTAMMFMTMSTVAFAAEDESAAVASSQAEDSQAEGPQEEDKQNRVLVEIPDCHMKISVSDVYDYVMDGEQVYRGDFSALGVSNSDMTGSIAGSTTRVDALIYSKKSIIESYLVCDPTEDVGIKNLSTYSDKEVESFSEEIAKNAQSDSVTSEAAGAYRDKHGIVYACTTMTATEGSEKMIASCMCTVLDGVAYYYYTRGDDLSKTADDYKELNKHFVDGVTYDNAPLITPTPEQTQELIESLEKTQKELEEAKKDDPLSTEKQFQVIQQSYNEKYNQSENDRPKMDWTGRIIYIVILSCIVTFIRAATRKKKDDNNINSTYDPNGTNYTPGATGMNYTPGATGTNYTPDANANGMNGTIGMNGTSNTNNTNSVNSTNDYNNFNR